MWKILAVVLLVFSTFPNVRSQNVTGLCYSLTSCERCVAFFQCYWCQDSAKCYEYKVQHVSTYFEHCGWGEARWKFCWLNVMALTITMSVICGIFFIALLVCCCWCCKKYRNCMQRRMEREEAVLQNQEDERKMKRDEKKVEHNVRTEAIRTKYGLLKEDDRE